MAILAAIPLRTAAAAPPVVVAAFTGAAVPVFDTATQACDPTDTPDTPARAFKDAAGIVHLYASNAANRALTGTSLLAAKRNCTVTMVSPLDAKPAHFAQYLWLAGFYTQDGRKIAALVHSEYHGDLVPGMCSAASTIAFRSCWYNTITYAQSTNSGASFVASAAPDNLVASVPYQYSRGIDPGPVGYHSPTGIVTSGRFFYAMINNWPYKAQGYGPCLIRTNNPFAPSSWTAWDGSGFNVQFANPYVQTKISNPANFVCAPVGPGALGDVQSLVYHAPSGAYVTTQFTPDARWGVPGLYLSASWDLVAWSKPLLVVSAATLLAGEPAGKWHHDYFSLLDNAATDRSFATITNNPMVYYIRHDDNHGPYTRLLSRRPLTLTIR